MKRIARCALLPRTILFGTLLGSLAGSVFAKEQDLFPGNPPITPRWAFEPWVWEDHTNTQASTEKLVAGYLSRDIPVGAVIVDSPWETAYNTLVWDRRRYAQPQVMIDGFHTNGVHVVLWITGFINKKTPDYDFVRKRGYVVDGGGNFAWWKGSGFHIDFTNPSARKWWNRKLDNVLSMGIDGWKVDMGADRLGKSVATSIGDIPRQDFKRYYYADFFDHTLQKNPAGAILARPYSYQGGTGAPISKLSIGWTGDYLGNWDGLKRQLTDIYRSAQAGYGAFGTEIGGYKQDKPGKSILIRWAQLGAMTPLMENGGGNGGETNHLPWYHDRETEDIYRYFATLHSELVPYLFSYGVESHLHGGSIIKNPEMANEQHQLGEEIFVSVVTSAVTRKRVTFPPGARWIDYWDQSKTYPGGTTLDYTVQLDRYPVFIKAGAIIPMHVKNSVTGHGDRTSSGKETLLIFPHGQSAFLYHKPLDDGIAFSDVMIRMDEAQGTISVDGADIESYRLRIKWPLLPETVRGAKRWWYDADDQYLIVYKTGKCFQITIVPPVATGSKKLSRWARYALPINLRYFAWGLTGVTVSA